MLAGPRDGKAKLYSGLKKCWQEEVPENIPEVLIFEGVEGSALGPRR